MILNLAYPDKSEIQFDKIDFPDGQHQINLVSEERFFLNYGVHIISRFNNWIDLELIICAVKSLRNIGVQAIHLETPYFLGARSDRKFHKESNNYLRDVVCPIINSLNLTSVNVLDPHSNCLEMGLNNFWSIKIRPFYEWCHAKLGSKDFVVIQPDAGAKDRANNFLLGWQTAKEIIVCSKTRVDGKIVKTEVPHFDITKNMVIVDDICDGGKTFIEIGKVIQERKEAYMRDQPNSPEQRPGDLFLVVTHGIFSKGLSELSEYFKEIYTTNSYYDRSELIQYNVLS